MDNLVKIVEFYNYFKGAIDPLFGIFIGAILTYKITFGQVKKSNKFVVLKEIKQELMISMDNIHKSINTVNMKSNDFYKSINLRNYLNSKIILDDLLFLFNEMLQIKNTLISNFELLNSIFGDYIGKSELSSLIANTDKYLTHYYEEIYRRMCNPAFYQENFVSDHEYIKAIDNLMTALQHDDFKNHYNILADSHVGKVVEFINIKLVKLVK